MFSNVFGAFFLFAFCLYGVTCDEFGCVGFVKSDVDIDYEQIEIKLFTADGIQKHQSELAPINGYYMIPFVEKGNFILKIDPPSGWIFEPMTVKLDVDGETDACSKSQDINFYFKGFTLSGKVINQYSSIPGPEGVDLSLVNAATKEAVAATTSTSGGIFAFRGVKPGNYEIKATHDSFLFHKANIEVTVSGENAICKEDIIVSGYDVHGIVTSQSLAVEGVHFLLFSQTERTETMKGCDERRPEGSEDVSSTSHPHYICSTTSAADGSYVFATLPSASYIVMPFHRGERIQFDVEPRQLEFSVTNDRIMNQQFEVVGFSVKGKIVNAPDGDPVVGAKVIVDGKERGVTDENGFYTLKNMNNGAYQVVVEKENFKFLTKKLAVSTETPQLPDIVPDQFAVCGQINIEEKPRNYNPSEVKMSVLDGDNLLQTTSLDSNNKFCFYLSPGTYTIEAALSNNLMNKGLAIQPQSLQVQVSDRPISDVEFNQYRATVEVKIKCIKSCDGVMVKLANNKLTLSGDDEGVATFKNILPGKHDVRVSHSSWCWKEDKKEVVVSHQPSSEPQQINFEQSGFLMVCSITHDTTVDIELDGKVIDTIEMKKRESKLCLSRVGVYNLIPKSCHRFDTENQLTYDTDEPKHVVLNALSHQARFQLETVVHPQAPKHITANVKSGREKASSNAFVRNDELSTEDKLVYELIHWVKNDEENIFIEPSSSLLLFEPASATVTSSSDDCYKVLKVFTGIVGKFVRGRITPALSDVAVTLSNKDGVTPPVVVRTGKDGTYTYGPLHPDNEYTISAAFKDHSLLPISSEPGSFVAKKLSKIIFKVRMGENPDEMLPLGGVILAVSGGSYRSQNLTGNDGQLVISKLEPGQYYFKAAMKEYKFTPLSQVVDIEEGKEKVIEILGKRTAFSCYGNVTSLNNEPEADVHVRAKSIKSEACGENLIEESTTNSDGKYVIKGLIPGCEYDISVHDANSNFANLIPSKVTRMVANEDMHDLKFIVFRPQENVYLSGYVMTEREHLNHIKIALYQSDDTTTAVHVVKMNDESPFFHFPRINRDGKEYMVRLESTLSTSNYEFSAPTAGFFATGSQKHITFQFYPIVKKSSGENTQVSVASLPLIIALIVMFCNSSQIISFVQSGISFWKSRKRPAETNYSAKTTRKNRK